MTAYVPAPAPVGDGLPGASVPASPILVVDDSPTNRAILAGMLVHFGHQVLEAQNGVEAIELFQRHRPALVIMDVMMPEMDGYEATRRIKALSRDTFVPVLFLTALTEDSALARCVEVGGDDFLSKPFSQVILQAKLRAAFRTSDLYRRLQEQRDQLSVHQQHLQRERETAERLFRTIIGARQLRADNLRFLLSPHSLFNGDVLLTAATPTGGLHVMLGDFTGHGLQAAVGTVPISDLFYGMTAKGFGIPEIAQEANRKLKEILPTGVFCAACLVSLDPDFRMLGVWNGGMPDVLVAGAGGSIRQRLASRHLPLGILSSQQWGSALDLIEVEASDRVYLCSDGLTEARNAGGELYGQARLERCIARHAGEAGAFAGILADVAAFRGEVCQGDDTTLIQLDCRPPSLPSGTRREAAGPRPAMDWRLSLRLDASSLRQVDPLPLLAQALVDLQGLQRYRDRLFTVLAELFTNALDHGVLGLDSAMKASPAGFQEYYRERERRLAALAQGGVLLEIDHRATATGGLIRLRVEDTGPGFDPASLPADGAVSLLPSGRGLTLVRRLCREVRFLGRGNQVEASYEWEG